MLEIMELVFTITAVVSMFIVIIIEIISALLF